MSSSSVPVRPPGRILLLSLLLALPALSVAKPVEPGLREAIAAALSHNPDLAGFAFDLRAAEALGAQAALSPAPDMLVELENFAGSGEARGFDGAEATFALSQVIELGAKRDARIAVADAGRDQLRVARQAAQLDVLAEVTRRFIAVAERQEQQVLTRRATELAQRTLEGADLRVRAAKAPHVEFDRATVALARADLDERNGESRLDAARRSLAAMWGAADTTIDGQPFMQVRGELFRLPAAGDFTELMQRLLANPDFLRFASEARLRDAELRLAATQRRADVTLGAGLRRLQGSDDTALVASFSMPLFAGRRADGVVAEAAARRDAVGAAREAALVKARAQLYALHRELLDAIGTVRSLEATAIPRMEEALEETVYAFQRGRYSYLELVDAQREYLEIQARRIEASARAQTVAAEIERLCNAPLAP